MNFSNILCHWFTGNKVRSLCKRTRKQSMILDRRAEALMA
jgi:hypothetical protein